MEIINKTRMCVYVRLYHGIVAPTSRKLLRMELIDDSPLIETVGSYFMVKPTDTPLYLVMSGKWHHFRR